MESQRVRHDRVTKHSIHINKEEVTAMACLGSKLHPSQAPQPLHKV